MYLLNKKQQKTDRKIGVFAEAPPAGAWIEIVELSPVGFLALKPLPQGRELKLLSPYMHLPHRRSPSRRGVNWNIPRITSPERLMEAPPAGAWIEIPHYGAWQRQLTKPLPQGRELKYLQGRKAVLINWSPSRRGVNWNIYKWHLIAFIRGKPLPQGRELKYFGMKKIKISVMKPLPQGRELKFVYCWLSFLRCFEAPPAGAWIEITRSPHNYSFTLKPLPQGRELKYIIASFNSFFNNEAPPAGAWIEMDLDKRIKVEILKKPLPQGRELKLNKMFLMFRF